jgi:ribosomal protein S6
MSRTVVFLFDVDNALLDNDRVTDDLKRHLAYEVGLERQGHYALGVRGVEAFPAAARSIERIGDLLHYDLKTMLLAGGKGT